jgi:hypothetical protein
MKRLALLPAFVLVFALAFPARADTATVTWHMDEAPGSTTITDATGTYTGTLENDGAGASPTLVSPSTFDASNAMMSFDGHGRVVVPDADALDPNTAPFSVTVHVDTTTVPDDVAGDFDLIRKGLVTDKRYWKVELFPNAANTKAFAFCMMRGYRSDTANYKTVRLKYTVNLANGAWHTITCTKTDNQVTLAVDGTVRVTNNSVVGSISNSAALSIGAKATSWDDRYVGLMDEVSYSIG